MPSLQECCHASPAPLPIHLPTLLLQECYRCHRFKNVSGTTALILLPAVRCKSITATLIRQYFLTASGMLPLRRLQVRYTAVTTCARLPLLPLSPLQDCHRICVALCCYARHCFELADIVAASRRLPRSLLPRCYSLSMSFHFVTVVTT